MRAHAHRIPGRSLKRSHTLCAGLTLFAGATAAIPAVAQTTTTTSVSLTFATVWALPNESLIIGEEAPYGFASDHNHKNAAVAVPAFNSAWGSLVSENSQIFWDTHFRMDLTGADVEDGWGSAAGTYEVGIDNGPQLDYGWADLGPSRFQAPTQASFDRNGTSGFAPPPEVGNPRRFLTLYSNAWSDSDALFPGMTSATQGMFTGMWFMTYNFTTTNTWTGSGGGGGGGGGGGWGGGWGGNPAPNAACATAYFGDGATNYTINLDVPVTLGTLIFDSNTSYTINGPNTLTLDCTRALVHGNKGSHTINAPIHYAANTIVSVTNAADTLTTAGPMSAAAGVAVEKIGAGTWAAKHVRASGLTVAQGAVKMIGNTNADGTSRVESLTVQDDVGAKLDIARNHLVVDYGLGATSPYAELQRLIKAGYHGGDWLGAGLTSSEAAADVAGAVPHPRAVGYAEAVALGLTTFGGQTVDADAVLVRLTYAGDANLDGVVNFDDQLALARNYNGIGKGWAEGDFNYDGLVNFDDLLILAKNYNQVLPQDPAFAPAVLGAAPVPEPATATLLFLAAAASTRRRARRPSRR